MAGNGTRVHMWLARKARTKERKDSSVDKLVVAGMDFTSDRVLSRRITSDFEAYANWWLAIGQLDSDWNPGTALYG